MKQLPKTIFVTIEDPGTEDEYLHARQEREDLIEMDETKVVGEYVLKRRVKIRGVAEEIGEVR